MTRKRKVVAAVVAGVVLPVAAVLLYLAFSDLSGWRDTAARLASRAMDRELTIAGDFDVDAGLVTRIHATGVSLANTEWGSEPEMATIDRLDAEIALWPLLRGVVHLPAVDLEGGRAVFETDAVAGSNWALGAGKGSGGGSPVKLRIDRIRARGVELVFRRGGDRPDLDLAVTRLDSTGDESGIHELVGEGAFGGTKIAVEGRVGPLEGLIHLGSVEHDLVARVGTARAESRGSISELATLTGLDVELHATIPDPDELSAPAGLPTLAVGPVGIELTCEGAGSLTSFDATVTAEAFAARGTGTIDSLLAPGDLDAEVDVSGSDVRPIAALRGIDGLPEAPFELRGALRWRGFPITVSGLEARVGDNHLSADGTLGAPPTLLETDLRFTGGGPDLSALGALVGARLPAQPFDLEGRVLRVDHAVRVEDVRLAFGGSKLSASGVVGDPPGYSGTDLTFEASGPDSSPIRLVTGLALPSGPFSVAGRLGEGDRSIALHGVRATLAGDDATVDGRLTTAAGMNGTELKFAADIRNLSRYAGVVGRDELPAIALAVDGGVGFVDGGWRLDHLDGRSGDLDVAIDGTVTRRAGLVGTRLTFDASGPDLSTVNDLVPFTTLPAEPFAVSGRLSVGDTGYDLTGVELQLGGAGGRVDGRIGGDPGLDGSDLSVDLRGPDLSLLGPFLPSLRLPAIRFSVAGGIGVHGGSVELTDVTLTAGDTTAHVAGTVAPSDGFTGTEITADLTGSNVADFARLVADATAIELPTFPATQFSAAGNLSVDAVGYHLSKLELGVGASTASVRGVIGRGSGLVGSDLELRATGPDGRVVATMLGVDLPEAALSAEGRVRKDDDAIRFDGLKLGLGDYRAELDGTLGPLPRLVGTDLSVAASGPDLSALRKITGIDTLPPLAFTASGRFSGDPNHFAGDAIRLRLGSSDVAGRLTVDLEARPTFSATMSSRRVAISELVAVTTPPDDADRGPEKDTAELLFSDEPWDLSVLDRFDGRLDWTIDELGFRLNSYHDVDLTVELRDSRVDVEAFRGTGVRGGVLQGSGSLSPDGPSTRIEGRLTLDDAMVNLGDPDAAPGEYTQLDVALDLGGSGRSPHQLMAGANGRVVLTAVGGEVRKSAADLISADVLISLLKALNPFAKDEATELGCAVLAATFDHGVMTLDPGAIQTDAMTIIGDGTVDFSTEKLTLDWVSKPRKGVGLSASAITNSYIRLGGTLLHPSIEIKPLEAVATTGVAVATMGISLIAKGFFDRVTAEKKVCQRAMEKVKEMDATTSPRR